MGRPSARSKHMKSIAVLGNTSKSRTGQISSSISKHKKNIKSSQCSNVAVYESEEKEEYMDKKPIKCSSALRNHLKYARLKKSIKKGERNDIKESNIERLENANNVIQDSKKQEVKTAVRKPKANPKAWTELSREEKCRRLRKIEVLAPGATVTSYMESTMTAEESLSMSVMNNLTTRQVFGIRKATKGVVASNYAINQTRKSILTDYGTPVDVPTSSQFSIKTFLFEIIFIHFLGLFGVHNLPSLQTVVVSVDEGDKVTKAGCYSCDIEDPCSEKNYRILSSFEDKECYEYCKPVLKTAIASLAEWKAGRFVINFFIRVTFIITGDLKFLNTYCGLNGCQATFFCPFCICRRSELIERKRDAPLRTLQQIHQEYTKCQRLLRSARNKNQISAAILKCHSVKNEPMTDHFELTHICPGVLHTLAGALNAICDWAKKFDKERIEQLFKEAAVWPQGRSNKLSGNHGRILLNKLADQRVNYDGKGLALMLLLADIQQYATAEILTAEKIAELHECIEAFVYEYSKEEYDNVAKSSEHIHMLITHVMPFIELHKSWGLFSDQPGEAIHKTQQRYYKRIPKRSNNANSTRNAVNRNDYFIAHTILQNRFNAKK
uniref:Uncharacterized protein n=1 Tax=Panagrolaimus davidi TaxID=227884 RepID=A0A914QIE3_9BILA